jgi:hypothetical protein
LRRGRNGTGDRVAGRVALQYRKTLPTFMSRSERALYLVDIVDEIEKGAPSRDPWASARLLRIAQVEPWEPRPDGRGESFLLIN